MAQMLSSPMALPMAKGGSKPPASMQPRLSSSATGTLFPPESSYGTTQAERMMNMSSSSRRSLTLRCSPPSHEDRHSSSKTGTHVPPVPLKQTFGFAAPSPSRGSPNSKAHNNSSSSSSSSSGVGAGGAACPRASGSSELPRAPPPSSNSSSGNIVELPGLLSRALLRKGGGISQEPGLCCDVPSEDPQPPLPDRPHESSSAPLPLFSHSHQQTYQQQKHQQRQQGVCSSIPEVRTRKAGACRVVAGIAQATVRRYLAPFLA